MAASSHLTIGQIARKYHVAVWQARRAVDALDAEIPRAGLYRLVPCDLLDQGEAELRRRGYLLEVASVR